MAQPLKHGLTPQRVDAILREVSGCADSPTREEWRAFALAVLAEERKEAQMLRQRSAREKRYQRTRAGEMPSAVAHGISAYRNWGCRCEICMKAGREDNARTR